MPHPLHQKLDGLKASVVNRADSAPRELADVCIQLLELIELNRADLTQAYEVQRRTDQRLLALEQTASTYREPRG